MLQRYLRRGVVVLLMGAMLGLINVSPAAADHGSYCGHGNSHWAWHNWSSYYQLRYSYSYEEWWSWDQQWHHIHAYEEWRSNIGSQYIGMKYKAC